MDDRVATSRAFTIKLATPHTAEVITDAACSNAWILWNPGHVSRTEMNGSTPVYGDIYERSPQLNSPVLIGGPTISPTRTGSQEIVSPHGTTDSVEVGNTQIFNTSINGHLAEDGNSTPVFGNLIRRELSHNSSINIYSRCRVNFTSNAVRTEASDFIHLGLPAINTLDELRSFGTPATRFRRPTDGSNWSAPGQVFGELTRAIMSRTRSEKNYSSKTDFETRR